MRRDLKFDHRITPFESRYLGFVDPFCPALAVPQPKDDSGPIVSLIKLSGSNIGKFAERVAAAITCGEVGLYTGRIIEGAIIAPAITKVSRFNGTREVQARLHLQLPPEKQRDLLKCSVSILSLHRISPSKIRRIRVLPRIDNASPDCAGMRKVIEQLLSVTCADSALKRKKFFGEAAQNLKRCVFVGSGTHPATLSDQMPQSG